MGGQNKDVENKIPKRHNFARLGQDDHHVELLERLSSTLSFPGTFQAPHYLLDTIIMAWADLQRGAQPVDVDECNHP